MKKLLLLTALTLMAMSGCKNAARPEVKIDYTEFRLDNGLHVILQQDHSDPIVAVAIQYHVGAAREKQGKTGFAHFFEHMLFQRSENLPRNAFFQKIAALGGDFNGSTDSDGTRYYEVVPRDALEKVLWMESDRMGFFINTVTQGGLEREIDVVSNEKRQNYDTRPYGQLMPLLSKYGYPAGHPYSWTTIGEIADLRAATVEDVKEFYSTYYKPNNATLVISGDFEEAKAKELVKKYFGEIAKGEEVAVQAPMPAPMAATVKVIHEDAYASAPMLAISLPAVPTYHPDAAAVAMLGQVLSEGKNSPLYKVIVDEKKLAPEVEMWAYDRELAGNLIFIAQAFEGVDLNELRGAVDEAFARFEADGFDESVLEGFKALGEVGYYNRMSGIQGRALTMAQDDVFGGDPLRGFDDLRRANAVTKQDIVNAYNTYVKGRNALEISIVPQGQPQLALAGSTPAELSTESVADQTMRGQEGALVDDEYARSESAFDRSVEPELLSNTPTLNPPAIWKEKIASNGLQLWGATNDELPIVRFSLTLKGGFLRDTPEKAGVASLYASTLLSGTRIKTPEELEQAFKRLGASVNCYAGTEAITISGSCLSRNLRPVLSLVNEALTEPRFDENEFEKERQSALQMIAQQADDQRSIAWLAMDKLLFPGTILAGQIQGTAESVAAITLDDLKQFHADFTAPDIANLHIAGDVRPGDAREAVKSMVELWRAEAKPLADNITIPAAPAAPRLYFIDQPGAQQSYILIAAPAMPLASPDYYPAYIANFPLGEGSHGMLFDELRLKRGYTYGAYSSFNAQRVNNFFQASSKVQGSKTRESVDVFKQLLESFPTRFNDELMETTRTSILKGQLGEYETLAASVRMLSNISSYGLPDDYVKQREEYLKNVSTTEIRAAAEKSIDPARMTWVVVGDAATQLPRLEDAGLGAITILDKRGN